MSTDNYKEAFGKNDESLAIFLRGMAKFDREFCNLMANGEQFTLRLEINGNKGEMIHCRVQVDGTERPHGVEKVIEKKKNNRFSGYS